MKRALIACEFSGIVRDAFTRCGWNAVSCDLLPSLTPGPHYQCDVLSLLDQGWDLLIAFPPCTYLTNVAEWAYKDGPYYQRVRPGVLLGEERRKARLDAVDFVKKLASAPIPYKAIENPIGHLSVAWRQPDQILQPYFFGHDASKRTCLWLENLPCLRGTRFIPPRIVSGKPRWGNQTDAGHNRLGPNNRSHNKRSRDRQNTRSTTYVGIAEAMALQWSADILERQWDEITVGRTSGAAS